MPSLFQIRFTYDPPAECIYCGDRTRPRGDEHIIPRSMGGALRFKDASCKCCERIINTQIETPIANMIGTFRRRAIPVRNRDRKRRPLTSTIHIYDDSGNVTEHAIPSAEQPRVLYLPAFPPPALIQPSARSIHPEMWTMAHHGDLQSAKDKFGGVAHMAGRYDLDRFSRQLAKIAHAYVMAECPVISQYECLLPKFILDGVGDARGLVGGELIRPPTEKYLYRIFWGTLTVGETQYIISTFRLFAFMYAPFYQVLVARRQINQAPPEQRRARIEPL